MKNKALKVLGILTVVLTLGACRGNASSTVQANNKLGFSLICPKGAPGVVLADYLTTDKDEISLSAPADVVAGFKAQSYDAVIFDLTNGANLIKKMSLSYKLAGVLTNGNAYVISTGHDANKTIDASDNIVSFGTGSLFTKLFQKIHPVANVSEVSDVSTAYSVAVAGKNNAEDVDYVILSEPFVTKALQAKPALTVFSTIKSEWLNYSKEQKMNGGAGYDGFPQAGLFLSDKLDGATDTAIKGEVSNFIDVVNANSQDFAENSGAKVLAKIKSATDQKIYDCSTAFGIDYATLAAVSAKATNAGGLTNALGFNYQPYDVNGFLNEAAISGFLPIDASILSSTYYKAS